MRNPVLPSREVDALRAEHDALAARLGARRSIDHVRRGAYLGFAAFIAFGLSAKLAYDRWGPIHPRAFRGPPVLFFLALALALAAAAAATAALLRARRHMRSEDADYARLRDLRRRLELDA